MAVCEVFSLRALFDECNYSLASKSDGFGRVRIGGWLEFEEDRVVGLPDFVGSGELVDYGGRSVPLGAIDALSDFWRCFMDEVMGKRNDIVGDGGFKFFVFLDYGDEFVMDKIFVSYSGVDDLVREYRDVVARM